jgi:hypothetical protein
MGLLAQAAEIPQIVEASSHVAGWAVAAFLVLGVAAFLVYCDSDSLI